MEIISRFFIIINKRPSPHHTHPPPPWYLLKQLVSFRLYTCCVAWQSHYNSAILRSNSVLRQLHSLSLYFFNGRSKNVVAPIVICRGMSQDNICCIFDLFYLNNSETL